MNEGLGTRKLSGMACLLFAWVVLCITSVSGQVDRGAIAGRVMDSSGATVPRATVTVTNKATGVAIATPVNDAGEYQVLALIPGKYSVKASADGFDSVLRDDIELHVQDRLSIDFSLKVGSVSQEIVVGGGEPLLDRKSTRLNSSHGYTSA